MLIFNTIKRRFIHIFYLHLNNKFRKIFTPLIGNAYKIDMRTKVLTNFLKLYLFFKQISNQTEKSCKNFILQMSVITFVEFKNYSVIDRKFSMQLTLSDHIHIFFGLHSVRVR